MGGGAGTEKTSTEFHEIAPPIWDFFKVQPGVTLNYEGKTKKIERP